MHSIPKQCFPTIAIMWSQQHISHIAFPYWPLSWHVSMGSADWLLPVLCTEWE